MSVCGELIECGSCVERGCWWILSRIHSFCTESGGLVPGGSRVIRGGDVWCPAPVPTSESCEGGGDGYMVAFWLLFAFLVIMFVGWSSWRYRITIGGWIGAVITACTPRQRASAAVGSGQPTAAATNNRGGQQRPNTAAVSHAEADAAAQNGMAPVHSMDADAVSQAESEGRETDVPQPDPNADAASHTEAGASAQLGIPSRLPRPIAGAASKAKAGAPAQVGTSVTPRPNADAASYAEAGASAQFGKSRLPIRIAGAASHAEAGASATSQPLDASTIARISHPGLGADFWRNADRLIARSRGAFAAQARAHAHEVAVARAEAEAARIQAEANVQEAVQEVPAARVPTPPPLPELPPPRYPSRVRGQTTPFQAGAKK